MINELVKKAYAIAIKRGQWKDGICGALHSLKSEYYELAEAVHFGNHSPLKADEVHDLETHKEQVSGTIEDELADIVICCFSIAGHYGIEDFEKRIAVKMAINNER